MGEMVPANEEEVRNVVGQRLRALDEGGALSETVTVEWRGQAKIIQVISMPVDLTTYNPTTHRIRAQRTLDAARDQDLDADPFGASAQAYLHQLLMADPADPTKIDPTFEALKDDLARHGQNEPGIITRAGVLINGNTRRAALKEIGHEHIRVGVLPPDAAGDDLLAIELSLQLRKEHKRDYSFMNQLLAIDERVKAGRPAAEIQRDFRIQATTFERSRWILEFVRDAIKRSTVTGADGESIGMRLVDFETHQGKLEELYRAFMSMSLKDPDRAEALREQRLLAIALNKSKTDVRLIESDFAEKYLKVQLPDTTNTSTTRVIPGTSIQVEAGSETVQKLRALTDSVLKAKAIQLAPASSTPSVVAAAGSSLTSIGEALDNALDLAGRQGRIQKKRLAPVDRLSDVNDMLDLVVTAVAEARATGTLNPEDLDEGLREMRSRIIKLARQLATAVPDDVEPGAGVAWLNQAAES